MIRGPFERAYTGGWKDVQSDCQLCEMEKQTEWHLETRDFVIAEKLGGGPFIVSKHHEKELSHERRDRAERLVGILFDNFEIDVVMAHCPEHWHGHIRNYTIK
jgi:hypothetical protein